jgi:hypothetical protein
MEKKEADGFGFFFVLRESLEAERRTFFAERRTQKKETTPGRIIPQRVVI